MKDKNFQSAGTPAAVQIFRNSLVFLAAVFTSAAICLSAEISGELKQWHRVTVSYTAPDSYSETGDPNPSTDRRLDVVFTNGGESFKVPGYFAADGDAGNTSATEGKIWHANFAPTKTGTWSYSGSFYSGSGVAVADNPGQAVDTFEGTFEISPTDKSGRDHRGKGRLAYVGKHHLQFLGTGEYFMKFGTDSPEAFFCYKGFDGTHVNDGTADNMIIDWQAHVKDWKEGDPDWEGENGNGKGIIGALNYLALEEELNAFSFLSLSVPGDNPNSFPFVKAREHDRYDVSKLEQWEIVFTHADRIGLYIHFKLQEQENVLVFDKGHPDYMLGPNRKLYFREIIARFGHHLALNWNICEEDHHRDCRKDNFNPPNCTTTESRISRAKFLHDMDAYDHNIVIHYGGGGNDLYGPLLGDKSELTGTSIQARNYVSNEITIEWVTKSAQAGKPWIVAHDEQSPSQAGLPPDGQCWDPGGEQNDVSPPKFRRNVMWGNPMGGGAGIEIYFGFNDNWCDDRTCGDLRSRDLGWDWARYAHQFWTTYGIPFWDMTPHNDLVSSGWGLAKPGEFYVNYLLEGGSSTIDLSGATGEFEQMWYNPRTGEAGQFKDVSGGGDLNTGNPPSDPNEDWAVLVRKKGLVPIKKEPGSGQDSFRARYVKGAIRVSGIAPGHGTYRLYHIDGSIIAEFKTGSRNDYPIKLGTGIYVLGTSGGAKERPIILAVQ